MASPFIVKEHTCEAQHIREYPNATAHSQEDVLQLSIKQYIPRNNQSPKPGDVTIIGAHANGFVKELYEPLWEDLVQSLNQRGVGVRGIWMADVAWQGQSGILNDDLLGNDPSWHDHARDLLHMINHFRAHMPRPLIGVGHSFGGNIIVNLALLHPRLLTSLVLLDPVLAAFRDRPTYGLPPLYNSARRRDLWPSRAAAAASFAASPFYATWDPRCLALLVRHGLRDTPTPLHPDAAPPHVTLTTTKHQECFTYYRPLAQAVDPATGARVVDKAALVDADEGVLAQDPGVFAFYRAEGTSAIPRLPGLRPGVMWVFGGKSDISTEEVRAEKMALTGTGIGGSGGVKAGRVKQEVIEEFGHLVPMEATGRCAEIAAGFVAGELEVWRAEERRFREWVKRGKGEKQMMDGDWMRWLGVKERTKGKL